MCKRNDGKTKRNEKRRQKNEKKFKKEKHPELRNVLRGT